jgi:hypothetical protein
MFAAIFSLLVGPAQAATADDEAFENLAQEYISDLGNFSPVFATLLGDHGADGQLDQVDDAARAETRTLLLDYLQALNGIDREQLSRANQVDAELLLHEVESSLWSLDVLQEWAWNPLYYVNLSGSAIYGLLARDFASIETRLVNATSRLDVHRAGSCAEDPRGDRGPAKPGADFDYRHNDRPRNGWFVSRSEGTPGRRY